MQTVEARTGNPVKKVPVRFHIGNMIAYLAQAYGNGPAVVREILQNALDEGAKNVLIEIDCVQAVIRAYDDGKGTSAEAVGNKLIAESLKGGDPSLMGAKGIGNLAGLAVGEEWELITRDTLKKGSPWHSIRFKRSELMKSAGLEMEDEVLPIRELKGASFQATTVVRVKRIDKIALKQLGDRADVERTLHETFNAKLKETGAKVTISYRGFTGTTKAFVLRPTNYRGMQLDPVEIETEYGPVTFRFFYSAIPLDKPAVGVVHKGAYTIPLKNFFNLKILSEKIREIYKTGYFEGEVLVGFCTTTANRDSFVPNHELQVFVRAVEAFTEDSLEPFANQLQEAGREAKLKKSLSMALSKVKEGFGRRPDLIPAVMQSFRARFVKGDVPGAVPVAGPAPRSGVSSGAMVQPSRGTIAVPPGKPSAPAAIPPDNAPPEVKPDVLKRNRVQAQARRGNGVAPAPAERKRVVYELSDGLSAELIHPSAEETRKWCSRTSDGVIQLNIIHPAFMERERHGTTVLHQHMMLLIEKELTCASLAPAEAAAFDRAFDTMFVPLDHAVFLANRNR